MPLLIILAFLVFLFLIFRSRAVRGKSCNWQRQHLSDSGALLCYRCQTCGVDAYSSNGKRPSDCKRRYKNRGV